MKPFLVIFSVGLLLLFAGCGPQNPSLPGPGEQCGTYMNISCRTNNCINGTCQKSLLHGPCKYYSDCEDGVVCDNGGVCRNPGEIKPCQNISFLIFSIDKVCPGTSSYEHCVNNTCVLKPGHCYDNNMCSQGQKCGYFTCK